MAPVILQEELDANYEPTQDEIYEYAKFLGMNLDEDQDLLWIAKAGLTTTLPQQWRPCLASPESDEVFYFNFVTGESIWEHPCDSMHQKMYLKEKAKRAVRVIATLDHRVNEAGVLELMLTSMAGNVLLTLEVAEPQKETVRKLVRRITKEIGSRPRLVLPDGQLLSKVHRDQSLNVVLLGEDPASSDDAPGRSGDEHSSDGDKMLTDAHEDEIDEDPTLSGDVPARSSYEHDASPMGSMDDVREFLSV
jgi:centrosomal protein CEP164